ncbi:MAG: DUF1016 family protein [Deltaproteobacteria bacterium]|nr:DUF1016 family protein [Deltaproteobacteria bacterium]
MNICQSDYSNLVEAIIQTHQQSQTGAAGAVNQYLVLRNWLIGAFIVEFEQNGQDRAKYGQRLLARLAVDLQLRGIKGLGVSMLKTTRQFYRSYPQYRQSVIGKFTGQLLNSQIGQSLIGETGNKEDLSIIATDHTPTPLPIHVLSRFSWTHFIELVRLDDPWKRAFYENECLKGNWSVRQLQRQMGSLLYERTGLSTDKQAVIELARKQSGELPAVMADLIRDPYVLEFSGLAELPSYKESTLESVLLNHLQSFLLELGNGFCFEARQKRITVGNEHDYIDLVFYHRILRCHLLIDLKVRSFQHGDAGQMNFYLNYWKDQMMTQGDQPPVGLILCTDKDQTKVQYATGGLDHALFVSRYLVALPKPEQIEKLIENDRALWEQASRDAKEEGDK